MAGLDFGNLLGAVTNATTALSKEKGVKAFINNIRKFGVQVKSNFEVNFSGLTDATFFIQSIDIPGIKMNTTQLYYDGKLVEIPINYDYDRDFTMVVINDAQGYIYSALTNFIMTDATSDLAGSGYTMTIKALTGDKKHFDGALVTLNNVRLVNIAGLSYSYDDNSIQTFTINGKLQDFTYTPGAMQEVAGVAGTLTSLLG